MNLHRVERIGFWMAIACCAFTLAAVAFSFHVERETQCREKYEGVQVYKQAYRQLKENIADSMMPGIMWAGLFGLRYFRSRRDGTSNTTPAVTVFSAATAYAAFFVMCAFLLFSPVFTFHFVSVLMAQCGYMRLPF